MIRWRSPATWRPAPNRNLADLTPFALAEEPREEAADDAPSDTLRDSVLLDSLDIAEEARETVERRSELSETHDGSLRLDHFAREPGRDPGTRAPVARVVGNVAGSRRNRPPSHNPRYASRTRWFSSSPPRRASGSLARPAGSAAGGTPGRWQSSHGDRRSGRGSSSIASSLGDIAARTVQVRTKSAAVTATNQLAIMSPTARRSWNS